MLLNFCNCFTRCIVNSNRVSSLSLLIEVLKFAMRFSMTSKWRVLIMWLWNYHVSYFFDSLNSSNVCLSSLHYVLVFWFCIFISFSFNLHLHSNLSSAVKIISLDRFIFAVQNRFNHVINRINNQIRQQQFVMWMNFHEIITLSLHFANSTRSTFKRLLNDVIDTANNDVASKRRRERSVNSKDDRRASSINAFALYNSTSFEFVVVRSRQEIRRFARFASRASFFFQLFFQEDDDDDEFDDSSFARFYANLIDHEQKNEIAFEHASDENQKKKKKSALLNRRDKKAYAKEIVKQRVRVRKSDLKTRRDDKSLNFDYMIARKKDVIFDKHVLFEFQIDDNVCSFCDVYQYVEECHRKFTDDKYWHCCVNDKISSIMMTSEADS